MGAEYGNLPAIQIGGNLKHPARLTPAGQAVAAAVRSGCPNKHTITEPSGSITYIPLKEGPHPQPDGEVLGLICKPASWHVLIYFLQADNVRRERFKHIRHPAYGPYAIHAKTCSYVVGYNSYHLSSPVCCKKATVF
jgi:hypothetical protein